MKITMIKSIGLILVNGVLYIIYARKSTEDKRQLASIPDQLIICHRLEEKLGIKVPTEYIITDEKTAMKAHKRKGFDRMRMLIDMAVTQDHKVVLLAWDAARLARNNEEGGYLVDRVRDEQVKIFTDASGNFDQNNYTMLNIHFGFGSEYSKKTSQGVIRNMNYKVQKGICPTSAHLGYRFDPNKEKGVKDIIKNPQNWDKCREWIELMLTGNYTVEESLAIMTAKGLISNRGREISRSKAYFFFKDIYNTGLFYFHEELHQGTHPPLMTMREYQRIQQLIQDRGSKKRPLKELPYMGLFTCSFCGGKITGERHLRKYKNGESQEFCYYRCSRKGARVKELGKCKDEGLNEAEMNKQIQSYLNDIEMVPELLEWLKKVIKRQNQAEYHQLAKEQELQSKRLKEITRRKFELRAMKNEGFFPDEKDYLKEKESLLKQEQLIKQDIVTTDDSYWDALFEDLCNFVAKLKELYQSKDPVVQKLLVQIVGLNFELKDKKLKIKAKNAFIVMQRVKKELWEKNLWIEPENMPILATKRDDLNYSVFSGADERS